MAGQLHTLEIPNLNKVYEDDLCTLYIHDVYGDNSLLVLHVEVIQEAKKSLMLHYHEVLENLLNALRERGVKKLEAWMNTDEQIRFAQFFGFNEFLGELMVNGQHVFPPVYRLSREL